MRNETQDKGKHGVQNSGSTPEVQREEMAGFQPWQQARMQ